MPAWPDGAGDANAGASPAPARPGPLALARRGLEAFGRFWWDFLVGDTPELFVAVLVIVGLTALLVAGAFTVAAWAAMPLLVVAGLAISVLRGRRTG